MMSGSTTGPASPSISTRQSSSPDILEPVPPDSPTTRGTWNDETYSNQNSATFTQAIPVDNAIDVDNNAVDEEINIDNNQINETERNNLDGNEMEADTEVIDYDDDTSSSVTVYHEPENSNSSVSIGSWDPRLTDPRPRHTGLLQSHSTTSNDSSNSNNRLESIDIESHNQSSVPDAQIQQEVVPESEDNENEPPAKLRKLSSPKHEIELDGETCPICLDPWGNSSDHRLVTLKCGHLFGSKCIDRWLRGQPLKERACPTCKSKAAIRDMRRIYARRLVVCDISEVTMLQKQIETLQAEKSRTELKLQKSKIAHRACIQQLESLRSTLLRVQVTRDTARKTWRFALEKNLEISKNGGCRVLTYNCRTYEFYISQKSNSNLFSGYGIRKVNCIDHKLGQFIHLHTKPIRDITYSQPQDMLLSVSLDGCAKVVERGILGPSILTEGPLWSCAWDYLHSNEFYVGGVGGHILQYDIRNPSSYLNKISVPTYRDLSPVVSLCSTEYGLLSCHLNSCWLWVQNSSRQWEPRSLPVEGPFMSLCYDADSKKAVVSCRPAHNVNNEVSRMSRLTLCKFRTCVQSGETACEVEQTFYGSARTSLMTRPAWVRAGSASWVAAHSESDAALYLHGLDGVRTMTLPAAESALDVCSAQLNGDTILAALSDSRLRIYKAVATSS